jgi:hypothetical protein
MRNHFVLNIESKLMDASLHRESGSRKAVRAGPNAQLKDLGS